MLKIGNKEISHKSPVYIVGEIGINHNGSLEIAKKLIDVAVAAGFDAVKFQKRTPEVCVPPEQGSLMRETPWGIMSYMDYRHRMEFEAPEFKEIDAYCKERNIQWFTSVWDVPSIQAMEPFNPIAYKVPSAMLTNDALLKALKQTGRPILLSTGMSTAEEIDHAISLLGKNLALAHCTSTYPCPPEQVNLAMIAKLREKYKVPTGYSGHEKGISITCSAVALGACWVERHITLDRTMWGSDHASSLEAVGMIKLVRDIRITERALGDGVKRVYEDELGPMKKLRWHNNDPKKKAA